MELPTKNAAQPLLGYRTNEEWNGLLAEIAAVIQDLEGLEDPALRDKVFRALQVIDALHREALHRLVRLFKEGVLEQVVTDPAIRTLMEMYDVLPGAPASGGKWDFLTPEERLSGPRSAARAGQAQEGVRPYIASIEGQSTFPHWSPAPMDQTISDGEAVIFETDDGAILLTKVEGAEHALSASCPVHHEVMHGGTLNHVSWICPLGAGCVYDIRNGGRLGGGPGLTAYPVRQSEDGRLLIGVGIPHDPKLPPF
jgi:nitrite reductase/ring-hydroxylating ferredoxin subunit